MSVCIIATTSGVCTGVVLGLTVSLSFSSCWTVETSCVGSMAVPSIDFVALRRSRTKQVTASSTLTGFLDVVKATPTSVPTLAIASVDNFRRRAMLRQSALIVSSERDTSCKARMRSAFAVIQLKYPSYRVEIDRGHKTAGRGSEDG